VLGGHYGCGGVSAALSKKEYGMIDNWLRNIKDVYNENKTKFSSKLSVCLSTSVRSHNFRNKRRRKENGSSNRVECCQISFQLEPHKNCSRSMGEWSATYSERVVLQVSVAVDSVALSSLT
jgi:hypothetical protein